MDLVVIDKNEITHAEDDFLKNLRDRLKRSNLLNDVNNLDLSNATDKEFVDMFLYLKVFNKKKSANTTRAYKQDMRNIMEFVQTNGLTLKDIGFTEVKVFNEEICGRYANRSAARKLDLFRRLLDFGYATHFYKTQLIPWNTRPSIARGHYSDRKDDNGEKNRNEFREMTEEEAEQIINLFPEVVRTNRHREQYIKRNILIGKLLVLTGMKASEIWGVK